MSSPRADLTSSVAFAFCRSDWAITAPIADWTRGRTVAEVEAAMLEHSVPAGTIFRAPDMLADPHYAARSALVPVETERWGRIHMQNTFPKLSDTPGSIRSPASSSVGRDNHAVYGALGITPSEIERLAADGVI